MQPHNVITTRASSISKSFSILLLAILDVAFGALGLAKGRDIRYCEIIRTRYLTIYLLAFMCLYSSFSTLIFSSVINLLALMIWISSNYSLYFVFHFNTYIKAVLRAETWFATYKTIISSQVIFWSIYLTWNLLDYSKRRCK